MKRVLSILLAVAMLCCVFALVSCGGEKTPSTTKAPINTGEGTQAQTTVPTGPTTAPSMEEFDGKTKRPGFEDVDFGGKIFTIAAKYGTGDGWDCFDIQSEEDATDEISRSVTERNDVIADLYNGFVVGELTTDYFATLNNDLATGQNRIDLIASPYTMNTYANGNFYNLYNLDLDLTQPWYDQGFIRDFTIDGKLYGLCGDFALLSYDATWVLFFNGDVLENDENLRGTDLFELARSGKWTIDVFMDMCRKVAKDDGNSTMSLSDEGDVFGMVSSSFQIRANYFGAGQTFVSKTDDAAGKSTFTSGFSAPSAVAVTDTVIELFSDESTLIEAFSKVSPAMINGQTLFAPEVMRYAKTYSNAGDLRIGIIPQPKLSEDQSQYYHNVDNHACFYAVPKTIKDRQVISDFIEVFAYHSRYISYKEYLNMYKYTWVAYTETAEMVDIILSSRRFDLGYYLGWGAADTTYTADVRAGTNNVATLAGKYASAIQAAASAYQEKINSYTDGIA